MTLPTTDQRAALVQSLTDHAQANGVSILGVTLDVATLKTAFEMVVAAACMKQWEEAKAAAKAAADAITTPAQAEEAQRQP